MHGVILQMARTGRKRKMGPRYNSGDVKPEKGEDPREVAIRQPHRQMAPEDSRHDQRAETPLGILNIIGAIPSREYRAARRFASIVARYRAVLDVPQASPPSISGAFEPQRPIPPDIEDAAERKADYDAAFEALHLAGRTAANVVSRVAVFGEPCPAGCFPALMRGLERLAFRFELTDGTKSQYLGNAG